MKEVKYISWTPRDIITIPSLEPPLNPRINGISANVAKEHRIPNESIIVWFIPETGINWELSFPEILVEFFNAAPFKSLKIAINY